jgi:hypothetical protein
MGKGYVRFFAAREEALAHAVEKNLEADAPLAYLAVYGPSDDFVVVDAESGIGVRIDPNTRQRLLPAAGYFCAMREDAGT